ncbi:MAG: solute:sodium symporter family transporter [Lentisphaeria bacterium]|nr:solute:sodium symporter family transporter [Lentisphaeria bacterium]
MNAWWTLGSFLLFTAAVAVITWCKTRREDVKSETGFFLAGRSLTWPVIAGSLLLTNLSTEQLVGLNGDAFSAGLSVMVWEVMAVLALLGMALFFLPRFLKSGIATVPQMLEIRFDRTTKLICNLIFLAAYATILLPIILYTGAQGLLGILDVRSLTGIESQTALVWLMVWVVGLIGSAYALFGGLRSVAVSDLLNGLGLLIGGFMITYFGFRLLGDGQGAVHGYDVFRTEMADRLNSIGGPDAPVPFWEIFTGVTVINFFYWCTNQQIIQRTLAARNLKEGQKGVLCCAFLKLLGPLYLVLPGMMAYYYFVVLGKSPELRSVEAYGTLVRTVLPPWLAGFFCAVMVGAILSSFNSALNSTCTLFSLDLYKGCLRRKATELEVVRSGKYFGVCFAIISMCVAPLLIGKDSIFTYLQTMNGIYFIPIFSVVLMGLLNRRVPAAAAKTALIGGCVFIALCYFVLPKWDIDLCAKWGGNYHYLGIVFVLLLALMQIWSMVAPRREVWEQQPSGDVDLTPWRFVWPVAIVIFIMIVAIYWCCGDFSVLCPAQQ